jgi:tetratricopeptide (TPR) repeat protein
MREMPPSTLLQQLIRQREVSYEQLVRELEAFARTRQIDGTIGVRHLQRLARLERARDGATSTAALPGTRRLLREFFGFSLEELVGPPRIEMPALPSVMVPAVADSRGMVAAAAADSLEFLTWAENDRVPPSVLDHLSSELRRIAVDYVHRPLPPLLSDLVELRDSTFRLLRERPHPQQSRELFFVAGTVCTLLAHASQNMGHSSAARTQAATAWACAEQADHGDLRAWVRGTQALIAEWTDSYDQAIAFAREGQLHAHSTDSIVRLAAIEARTLARAGDTAGAIEAVERATRQRDAANQSDSLAEFGGLLTFPHVKQHYYAGSTLALAGRYVEAERTALDAIQLYETGPAAQRSYGDEALARVDVAVARVATDDIDGAAAALQPVFSLPAGQRIQQIAAGLNRVHQRLALPRYAGSRTARDLVQDIAEFTEVHTATAQP